MNQALSHIRVLDLSRILAGPFSTQNLADMGADVIKVERPKVGDDTRGWGPPFLKDEDGNEADAAYFLSANRGKKSITVDIAKPEGQQLIRELARHCDVVVENYKVGTLARYGLSYEDLRRENPRLVYCSITGFGQTGPYAPLPGYDFVFQGMGGLMGITGQPDGSPGAGPLKVGVAITDLLTGMYATTAILAALEHRNISGKGQHIDLALLDCVVSVMSYQAINYFMSGKIPGTSGNAHPNIVPYQVFPCREGHIIIAVGNDSQFADFCDVLNRPEWPKDERFTVVAQRNINREILVPMIAEVLLERTMLEWVDLLGKRNVPCGPIYNMQQVFEDPQVQHRQMRVELPHDIGVQAPAVANPIQFSETPLQYRRAAPSLGQNTEEVLSEVLGYSPERLKALRDAKAI